MVRKIRVTKKAYTRKSYLRAIKTKAGDIIKRIRVKKSKVTKTTFMIKDRGKPGKGPKILPKLKKGGLGFSLKGKTQTQINKLALAHAKKVGERKAASQLRALHVLNKKTNPVISKKAAIAARHVYKKIGTYKGK